MLIFWAKLLDMRLSVFIPGKRLTETCSFFEIFDKGFSLFIRERMEKSFFLEMKGSKDRRPI